MKIDLYEKIWMWAVGLMLAAFFTSTAVAAFGGAVHPPSHVETIDPTTALSASAFKRQGAFLDQNGRVHARVVGMTFAWLPAKMTLPAKTPITFHVTAIDVVHGFEIVRSNGQSMAIPGYVSQFTTQFDEPGEYLIVCNEYCGVGHHTMSATMQIVPMSQWTAPAREVVTPMGGSHGSR
jgi:cytochrome c oxidase subunit 2